MAPSQPPAAVATAPVPIRKVALDDVARTVSYLARSVELEQDRLLHRAIRQNAFVRRNVTASVLSAAVDRYFPAAWPHLEQVRAAIACLPADDTPAVSAEGTATTAAAEATSAVDKAPTPEPATSILPEVEVFLLTLVLSTMLRHGLNEAAAAFATTVAAVVRAHNRRSLDLLASKAYFYLSLAFERVDRLDTIRPTLLALYRTASLHRDQLCEATLTNLILRNYIHYNLIDQAQAFAAKTTFPEQASNNQYCRYLYYMGRLQATQLEYSDAFMRLLMAARKAPQDIGQGFVQGVHKLSIIVQLLMGEMPERSLFNQPGLRGPLKPYLGLTQAVRAGDVQAFEAFVAENSSIFHADRNYTLVRRLGHNVLKTGIRKLSTSYSRISLEDVAAKLHLPSAKSAEYICAKAIRDGVIEARVDHEAGCLVSAEVADLYSTDEPQRAFHRRVVFCLDVHNDAVRSMRYPPADYKRMLLADAAAAAAAASKAAGGDGDKGGKDKDKKKKEEEEEEDIDEIIKEIEDEMDEE